MGAAGRDLAAAARLWTSNHVVALEFDLRPVRRDARLLTEYCSERPGYFPNLGARQDTAALHLLRRVLG